MIRKTPETLGAPRVERHDEEAARTFDTAMTIVEKLTSAL